MKEWQLIVDFSPLKGSLNMAIDEFLFCSLEEKAQTYVRFYQWERPTVTLGYSQLASRTVNFEYCRRHGIDIVRRITGGKLVLHDKEVTYSVCSSDSEVFSSSLPNSYRLISQALICSLEKMGIQPSLAALPPSSYVKGDSLCFSHPSRDEIEVGGKKIVGSAQKRVGSKFIQHGSIPLEHDEELLKSVSILGKRRSEMRITSLAQALGKKVSFDWAVVHFIAGISEYFKINFKSKIFNALEWEVITQIQKNRYENEAWTLWRS